MLNPSVYIKGIYKICGCFIISQKNLRWAIDIDVFLQFKLEIFDIQETHKFILNKKKWSWQKQKQKTDVEMICIFNKMKTVLPIESKIGST